MTVHTIDSLAESALRQLYSEADKLNNSEREALIAKLRDGNSDQKRNGSKKRDITRVHTSVLNTFKEAEISGNLSERDVLAKIIEGPGLRHLLAHGKDDRTLLHLLLDFQSDERSDFDKLKPLIIFLLRIFPAFPTAIDNGQKTPLYLTMQAPTDEQVKAYIVEYLCGDKESGGIGSSAAIESLGMRMKSNRSSHALHKAIDEGVCIDKKIVCSRELQSCLAVCDDGGMTCLHKALTPPYSDCKRYWARTLVEINYGLLGIKSDSGNLTPLQHMIEAREPQAALVKKAKIRPQLADIQLKQGRRKEVIPGSPKAFEKPAMIARKSSITLMQPPKTPLYPRGDVEQSLDSGQLNADAEKALEDWLKRYCLTKFDNATARSIMYMPEKMLQVDFSCFEHGDVVSRESLNRTLRHYRLDQTLRCVYIPRITVKWDDDSKNVKKVVDAWGCVGRTDFYMVFDWLKNIVEVEKVIRIVVDDFADQTGSSHADKAIVECLQALQIETWDWRRMDISSELIRKAAENSVKEVYLYCSGNNAVLRSWSDARGLAQLKKLEIVHLTINQGLDSIQTVKKYVAGFKTDLEEKFIDKYKRKIHVDHEIVPAVANSPTVDTRSSKLKEEGEDGYEEQEWLKCMDKFADFIEEFDDPEPSQNDVVKVAIIDDGVKTCHAGLDSNIDGGESWVQQSKPQAPDSPYNTSVRGHGTVMAYFIRRVCPKVRLYVAKLDPRTFQGRVTFSMESAAKAIDWAVEKQVNVISMSWAIEATPETRYGDFKRLEEAINKAISRNILLFCAMPDEGAGEKNTTYPKSINTGKIFSIGAATRDGNPWSKTGDDKPDFYLPGVDLGIRAQRAHPRQNDNPPEKWHTSSGSSLSCALASGLAALVLHCATIMAKDRQYLQRHEGMNEAFESINVSKNRWLPVGTLFGETSITRALTMDARKKVLDQIVDTFLSKRRLDVKVAQN